MSDLTPVPTLSEFAEEVGKEPQWFSLGVHLNLAHDDLKRIENQYSCQGTNRCAAELFICYEKNKKPCWKTIAGAFEKIGDHNHAGQIRDKYCNLFEQLLSTQKDDNREGTPSNIEDLEYNSAGGILDVARNTSLSSGYETEPNLLRRKGLISWLSIVMNILILIMNIISGLLPTKIAKNLAKLLTNAI